MKEKLERHKSLIITGISIIIIILLYYADQFYLASILLLTYIVSREYLYNEYLETKIANDIILRIKNNINDNISNASFPISLIDGYGNILDVYKRQQLWS